MTANPPLRHGNHGASVSKDPERLLRSFEEDLVVRFVGRTPETYLAHLRAFVGWLRGKGLACYEVRPQDLVAYQSELVTSRKADGRPYSTAYQMLRLSAIRSFYRFLYRRGFVLSDPACGLEMPRQEDTLPRAVLSRAEVFRILAAPPGSSPRVLRDRAILETLYATGIRVGELIALTAYDLSLEEKTLRVRLGKGRRDRTLPLTQAACRALQNYLVKGRPRLVGAAKAAWLFLSTRGGLRMCRQGVGRVITLWVSKARVKKPVSAHTFRHTVATHLLKGRADIRHIQCLLGHRHLKSTERYTRVEVSDLREVLVRAHPRGR